MSFQRAEERGMSANGRRWIFKEKRTLGIAIILSSILWGILSTSQTHPGPDSNGGAVDRKASGTLTIPSRPTSSLFRSGQGKQKTEIHFDPATNTVMLKLLVQDPHGYFIPNLRRENFAIYENGILQKDVTVDVEHAPVSLALLLEFGGRAPSVSRLLSQEISDAGRLLLDPIGPNDQVEIIKYGDKVDKLADFPKGREALERLSLELGTPDVSETNLYDAVISTAQQTKAIAGRKAILLISSGVDTFSKASYQEAWKTAADCETPIYAISMASALRAGLELYGRREPTARFDWARAEKELQGLATASGGRAYFPQPVTDLPPIYDDIMENLKVRYVIVYKTSPGSDLNSPRTIQVKLVDPSTGGPVQIVDTNGKRIKGNVIVQNSFVPSAVSTK
jgi:Ca-activated chloride channel homolog